MPGAFRRAAPAFTRNHEARVSRARLPSFALIQSTRHVHLFWAHLSEEVRCVCNEM